MKRIGDRTFAFVPAVERVRYRQSEDKSIPLTTFHLKPMTAWDALRWDSLQGFEIGERESAREKAKRAAEVDLDAFVSHVVRIENVETDTGYETLIDAKDIRAFFEDSVVDEGTRREIWGAIRERSLLRLGEPERLRSPLTFLSGEEKSPPASASSTVGSAPETAPGESSEAPASETSTAL